MSVSKDFPISWRQIRVSLNDIRFLPPFKKMTPTKQKLTRFQLPAFEHAKFEKMLAPVKKLLTI